MNQRIRELAEQATRTVTMLSPGGSFEETNEYFDKEKFAELIVRECAEIARVFSVEGVEYDGGDAIREHFGVER